MDMVMQIQQTLRYIEKEVHKVSLFLKKSAFDLNFFPVF